MLKEWLPLFRLRPHYAIMVSCAIALSPAPQLAYALLVVVFAYFTAVHGELVNFLHDYSEDIRNPRMKGFAHITGKISLSDLKKVASLFLFMALTLGVILSNIKKEALLLILFAIHCAYSYSAPPIRLKKYWWGGLVTYTTYTATVLLLSSSVLGVELNVAGKAAIAFWLGSLSVWTLTSIPDQEYDKKGSIETPAIKFGTETCVNAYLPLVLLSIALSTVIVTTTLNNFYVGALFSIPAVLAMASYSRMKNELSLGIRKQTYNIAVLPYRYNMALVTLSYFFA